jgi:hypothetical protein
MDIDNSCGHFTAELGKKKKVLGLNLDAVDGDFSAQKAWFRMQSTAPRGVKPAKSGPTVRSLSGSSSMQSVRLLLMQGV